MEKAGVTLMGIFGIVTDLMRDWRNTPGLTEVLPMLDKYVSITLWLLLQSTNVDLLQVPIRLRTGCPPPCWCY